MSKQSSRITIAHVVLSLDVGGLERVVVSLLKGTDQSKFRAALCCLEKEGRLVEEVREACEFVAAMGKGPGVAYTLPFRLASLFRSKHVDIVHCHNIGPFIYGSFAGKLAGSKPVVYTVHGPEVSSKSIHVRFQRLPVLDRIVAVSEHVRRGVIERLHVAPAKVMTIVNGIDVARYARGDGRAQCRTELRVGDETPVVGVVARLTPEKDHDTLLEAFALLAKERFDAVLIVVGDGPMLGRAREAARRLGIESAVRFTGTRLDVPELLSAFDVFAMSSREEGLGITLIEAMAAGLPVVATAAGGIPEIVQNELTGYLVPPGDPRRLADALLDVLADPARARRMGAEGRKRAEQQFGLSRMIGAYEQLYAELAAS